MSQQQNGVTQAATWLGMAGAVIGILAFFGITSYDDLKQAIGDDPGACQMAEQARNDFHIPRPWSWHTPAARTYAAALTRAADRADTPALATALRTHAVSLEAFAQYRESRPASIDILVAQHTRDENAWRRLCSQH